MKYIYEEPSVVVLELPEQDILTFSFSGKDEGDGGDNGTTLPEIPFDW